MQIEEVRSLLDNLSRPLGSELTRQQAVSFFAEFLRVGLSAGRAQVFIFNSIRDPIAYPQNGEGEGAGCDVDLVEQAATSGQVACTADGADVVIPLRVQPVPFGLIAIRGVKQSADQRLLQVVGTLASGLLCCGRPPSV